MSTDREVTLPADRSMFEEVLSSLEGPGERCPPRERDVLYRLVVFDETYQATALALGVSERTVEAHVGHAVERLGFPGRRELLRHLLIAYVRKGAA